MKEKFRKLKHRKLLIVILMIIHTLSILLFEYNKYITFPYKVIILFIAILTGFFGVIFIVYESIINNEGKTKEIKEKDNNYIKLYDYNQDKVKDEKKNKKINIKFSEDRIYEETVKCYGKHYVKNRSKADVVDEYLKEEQEMFENKK